MNKSDSNPVKTSIPQAGRQIPATLRGDSRPFFDCVPGTLNADSKSTATQLLADAANHRGERWLTFVTTERLTAKIVKQLGFDPDRVRVVKAESEENARWIMWEALRSGTSDLVAADIETLSVGDKNKLAVAGRYGKSQMLILESSKLPLH